MGDALSKLNHIFKKFFNTSKQYEHSPILGGVGQSIKENKHFKYKNFVQFSLHRSIIIFF